jgi:hypothetical protein
VSRARGQASVELAAIAPVLLAGALALAQLVLVGWAQVRAERIADQAAVVAAQGRDVPAGLREEARIALDGDEVSVRVAVPSLVPGVDGLEASASARLR